MILKTFLDWILILLLWISGIGWFHLYSIKEQELYGFGRKKLVLWIYYILGCLCSIFAGWFFGEKVFRGGKIF